MSDGLLPEKFSPKSFWERKEGTTGMVLGIPLLGLLGWGFYKALPYLITLMQNTITFIGLSVVATALFYAFVIDRRIWTLMWYGYKSLMRLLTRTWATIDPIGILRNYVSDLRDKADNMYKQINKLGGQMKILSEQINENERNWNKNLSLAASAQKQKLDAQVRLKSRKAGRLAESNMTLQTLYTKMEILHRVLVKMYESCKYMIEDLSDEVDVQEQKRAVLLASYSAFKSALGIINGDKDKKEVFDQALEYLANDYGSKIGEITSFMDLSKDFMESIDLQNCVFKDEAMKQLEAWEKKTSSLVLGDEKARIIEAAHDPNQEIDLDNAPVVARRSQEERTAARATGYEQFLRDDESNK